MNPILSSLFAVLGLLGPQEDADASIYVLRRASLLSPERQSLIEHAAVVIADGRIAWVGEDRDLPDAWAAARAVDLSGRFIVPGFIDSHVHVGHLPFLSDSLYEAFRATPYAPFFE